MSCSEPPTSQPSDTNTEVCLMVYYLTLCAVTSRQSYCLNHYMWLKMSRLYKNTNVEFRLGLRTYTSVGFGNLSHDFSKEGDLLDS